MSEPASISTGIAARYATAMFELASEQKALPALEADIEALDAALSESADLRDLIDSPIYGRDEMIAAIGGVADAMGLPAPLTQGSAVASDAFFPFADGLMEAAGAGATCVIQPGGSMRDEDVIKAADEAGLAMVLTGMRHFRH